MIEDPVVRFARRRGWFVAAALLICLTVAACTTLVAPRPPWSEPPPDREAAARLVAAARDDWLVWGGQRVSLGRDGRYCAWIDGACVEVEDGCGLEQTAALCPLVDRYWASVLRATGIRFAHDCRLTDVCRARWPADSNLRPIDTPAWSAAFISTMMARAGFDAAAFRQSPYHADYVVAARDRSTWAFDLLPTPARAEPGDLICATRFAKRPQFTPAEIDRILPSTVPGGPTPMHCDLVIEVDPVARRLDAIGGNVMQAVSRLTIDLDEEGRVSPHLDPARPWLLVLKLAARYRPLDDCAVMPGPSPASPEPSSSATDAAISSCSQARSATSGGQSRSAGG